jgi:ATP-dependent helicase/nuclease subunit A
MTRPTPPDQAARDQIHDDLGSTLFVEAGAGSGKTSSLVGRVVALVASGSVELRAIAAITFTEKAAAELRDRIRQDLESLAADATRPAEAERARVALGQLDGAAIGTLHSFAQRILSEHPVEARLPPRVEVLDEVTSAVAFDRRWARILDQLLDDPDLERTLLLLSAAGVEPPKLRSLALAFDASWDLVEDHVPETAPEPPSVGEALPGLLAAIDALSSLAGHCTDPDDRLLGRIEGIEAFGAALRAVGDDDLDLLEVLGNQQPNFSTGVGRQDCWGGMKPDVQEQISVCAAHVERIRGEVLQACARHLGSAMRHHTLAAAHARRAAGHLEFHDLLVLARHVLRDPEHGAAVRMSLADRYQRLLLDEFQDTDPIQIELAVRIAAADPATATEARWADVPVAPGRLFVVGDPKQSIYRFRRADISMFLEAKERYSPEAGGTVELTANFRTVDPVIDWVNATFGTLMGERPELEIPVASQPDYVALAAQRSAPPAGPPVAVVGGAAHPTGTKADEIRAVEARDVAHAVTVAIRERWQVADRVDGADRWRHARLGDITILVPARTSLPFLEDALEAAGIPFRAESSSLVYASRAVRDLLMVLRAADDPTDHLRIVAALRTPLLGCGDDDLYRHKVDGRGSWAYNGPKAPDPAAGPVAAGLAFLREVHEARHWQSPAELLDLIARERRAFELGFVEGRPRDVWRRLRFVIDQARAWSEATGGNLRSYLRWVDQQTAEGARVTESVLPETDDDAVRIMTIHAAKGLEFPITIVSGMSTGSSNQRNAVDVVFPKVPGGAVGYYLGKQVVTAEWEANLPIDEQMGYDERIRLLYVACTRACDHLVVSLHRCEKQKEPAPTRRTNSELLLAGMGDRLADLPDLSAAADGPVEPLEVDPATVPGAPPAFETWQAERARALARATRPGAVAATALTDEGSPDAGDEQPSLFAPPPAEPDADADPDADAAAADAAADVEQPSLFDQPALEAGTAGDGDDPGLKKRPRDLDLPPWLKGRYGTAVGRAVHGVLQTVDLADAEGAALDAAVAAQCQAEAVPERAEDVRSLVEAALASDVVREAATAPHWREVYACTPVGDRLLEGYVDLLYRSPDGLVVVDHKTAATSDPDELDRRVQGYRLQGAAYAVSVGQATGEAVTRVVFLFLTPQGAVERELPDLAAAMADVERLVAAGDELVTA